MVVNHGWKKKELRVGAGLWRDACGKAFRSCCVWRMTGLEENDESGSDATADNFSTSKDFLFLTPRPLKLTYFDIYFDFDICYR